MTNEVGETMKKRKPKFGFLLGLNAVLGIIFLALLIRNFQVQAETRGTKVAKTLAKQTSEYGIQLLPEVVIDEDYEFLDGDISSFDRLKSITIAEQSRYDDLKFYVTKIDKTKGYTVMCSLDEKRVVGWEHNPNPDDGDKGYPTGPMLESDCAALVDYEEETVTIHEDTMVTFEATFNGKVRRIAVNVTDLTKPFNLIP